jgi:hypothetical protein
MFLTPNSTHSNAQGLLFAITKSGNQKKERVSSGALLDVGEWKHVAVVLSGSTAILYENSIEVARNVNMTLKPSDLGSITQNYIGKSIYAIAPYNDPYFDGEIDDFRIYNDALDAAEIKQLAEASAKELTDEEAVAIAKEVLDLGDTTAVTENLILPVKDYNGVTIS